MSRPLCAHPNFEAFVNVVRIEDKGRFMAECHVRCTECKVRFRWMGLDAGLMFDRPMTSVDGFELRAPIEPDAHGTSMMAGPETGFPVPGGKS